MPTRVKVIACPVVLEELSPFLPVQGVETQALDLGLHTKPKELQTALQAAVDSTGPGFDAVVLGYGLCSKAVVGVVAQHCQLVVPRVDDCIGLFLGSHDAHREQLRCEPGTYYLTKGWIDAGDSPFVEYDHRCERWGIERADRLMGTLLKHYTRLVFIRTGQNGELAPYQRHARDTASRFKLRYEELKGSPALVEKILRGPWDEDFVVVAPGDAVPFESFCSTFHQSTADPAPAHG